MLQRDQIKKIDELKKNLRVKTSDELLDIWNKNDRNSWVEEAFIAIKEILEERKLNIPEQYVSANSERNKTETSDKEQTDLQIGLGIAAIVSGLVLLYFQNNQGYIGISTTVVILGCIILFYGIKSLFDKKKL